MSKFVLSAVLCVLLAANAFSLNCWVSDLASMLTGELKHERQNCVQAIRAMMPVQQLPSSLVLKCYKVNVKRPEVDVEVKGCVPSGGCGMMKEMFKNSPQMGGADVTCSECDENYCN